jgi:4'-phosphopantetheinyl transferase
LNTFSQIQWPGPPEICPGLDGDAVHVWAAEFEAWRSELPALLDLLSADERRRAQSFRVQARREASIITRGLLRRLLARYLNTDPRDLQFSYGAQGKPALNVRELQFNTSHSATVAAFALTRRGEIGVDVELIRPSMSRAGSIAEKFFSPEELAALRETPEPNQAEAFFRCWTRKEAFLKARGDGVFGGLNTFAVNLDVNNARLLRIGDDANPGAWWLAPLRGIQHHAGAVAVQAKHGTLRCWSLHPRAFPQAN